MNSEWASVVLLDSIPHEQFYFEVGLGVQLSWIGRVQDACIHVGIRSTSTIQDDAAAIGRITDLRECWDHLTTEGPGFGYFPNPSKTWLVTKEGCYAAGISTFTDTGVNVMYS